MDSIEDAPLRETLIRHLQSWERSGVSAVPRPAPVAQADVAAAADAQPVPPTILPDTPVLANESTPVNDNSKSRTSPQTVENLDVLNCRVADCTRCPELAETRTRTVFGVGDANARLMFIGEAPGADEDRTGEPFVGRAGQLLNKIIEACGWTRDEIYITNILKCRPPGNRNPNPDEAANCREFLDAQIDAVDPEYIVCWGSIAAKNLLDSKESIGRMRKKFFRHGDARVLCTYHPSYLLRNPAAKKDVWDDMKLLMRDMGLDPDRATT